VLAAVTAWIDPLRDAYYDDDFAYARMVQGFLRTGQYRADAWCAFHLPFQILWGALFSLPFGCSPGALRVSTLVVFAAALGCFHQLLRDHDTPEPEAGLITFTFLSCPMVQNLAFGFMTDLHHLSWFTMALFGYARGLARERLLPMALGSVAGCAAIGTRHVGVALVCGLAAAWVLDPARRRRAPLYLAGLALPALAVLWQVRLGFTALTFSQEARLLEQAGYLADRKTLWTEIRWRPTAILQYAGWYVAPLFPVFLVHGVEAAKGRGRPLRPILLALAAALFGYGSLVAGAGRRWMPSLPWLFGGVVVDERVRAVLHVGAAVSGVSILWLALRLYVPARGRPGAGPADVLLGLVAAATLAANELYVQLGDRYVIVYVPFALWVVGRTAGPWGRWTRAAVLAGAACSFAWGACWTNARMDDATARFALGDLALARGADPRDVAVGWTWQSFHGAYDTWVLAVRGYPDVDLRDFFDWLRVRNGGARYTLTDREPGADATVVAVREGRDMQLRRRRLWLLDRRPGEPRR
jgi:hypothetical protein